MKAKVSAAAIAVLLMTSGCGTLGRLNEYGMDMSDARFRHDGRAFTISVHPREDTFLIRPGTGEAVGRGLASGLTLGLAGRPPGYVVSRAAASEFIAPSRCEIIRFRDLDSSTGFWEADYHCPADIDLRQMVMDQRGGLREGRPLHSPEG